MSKTGNKQILFAERPTGAPTAATFELADTAMPEPGEGEFLVRNIFMSVDPYMRGRMVDTKSYIPGFQIGEPLEAGAVGEVIKSNHEKIKVGDHVLSLLGWREYYVTDGKGIGKIDPKVAPIQHYLGLLGMPGLTAYVGLLDLGTPKEGETVFVSSAAGAVGMLVGQIAKIKGCRVVGSAGTDEKVKFLTEELGFDAAFNYRGADYDAVLKELCPKGIDINFENVGGPQMDAVMRRMRANGRVILCGLIDQYNDPENPTSSLGPVSTVLFNRLMIKGFIVLDHYDRMPAFHADAAKWLAAGQIKYPETVVDGIENAPQAFLDLMAGKGFGKMLVRIGPDA